MRKLITLRRLKHHAKWLDTRSGARTQPGGPERALHVMVGCFHLLHDCDQNAQGWLARHPEYREWLEPKEASEPKEGLKTTYRDKRKGIAIRRLVAFTIEAVKACTWVEEFRGDTLPPPHGETVTSEGLPALPNIGEYLPGDRLSPADYGQYMHCIVCGKRFLIGEGRTQACSDICYTIWRLQA